MDINTLIYNMYNRRMQTRSQTRNTMNIQTRSQTVKNSIQNIKNNPIDFDEASIAWRQNKIQLENGCFKYTTKVFPETPDTGGMVLRSRQI